MASTTSTTLSPLVAGAADLARKLAAYKATSNTASGVREEEYTGEIIPSPLDVSFFSQKLVFGKSTNFYFFYNCFCKAKFIAILLLLV